MVRRAVGADYVCGGLRMGLLGESLVAVFTFFGEKKWKFCVILILNLAFCFCLFSYLNNY